jgi:ElaB/YqjD/DUF883 family membrane-anchored ribosome-binding protein
MSVMVEAIELRTSNRAVLRRPRNTVGREKDAIVTIMTGMARLMSAFVTTAPVTVVIAYAAMSGPRIW